MLTALVAGLVVAGIGAPIIVSGSMASTREKTVAPRRTAEIISHQAMVSRGGGRTTSERRFFAIPRLHLERANRGVASATLTIEVGGGPVEFKVTEDGSGMAPGPFTFRPTEGRPDSVSFTFASPKPKRVDCREYDVLWRSPSGKPVTLHRASLVVTYRYDDTTPDGKIGCI